MPILNRALTRSAPRSAMRLASSWTVIASGTTTSRTCLADGPASMWWRFSFSRARRSAASERARLSSSSLRARVTVSLPRWRSIVAAAARARRLGPLAARAHGRGRRTVALLVFFALRRGELELAPARRASAARRGLFLGDPARLLRRQLPRPCDFLRRGGARPRSARALRPLLAAAGFLERGHARFLGLAQQACLQFLARGDVVLRRGLRGCGAGAAGFGAGLGASATGAGSGRLGAAELRPGGRGCGAS